MSSFAVYQELKNVKPHLLTRVEYARLVREASQKVIKEYIVERNQASKNFEAWEKSHPEPKRPSHVPPEDNRWGDKYESYRNSRGDEYQKVYHLYWSVVQLKHNIILSRMIEDGRYEIESKKRYFDNNYGGVNNPLLNHGQDVFRALYRNIEIPERVLAEWPEGVEQVRNEMARQAAFDKAHPEYAHL